MSATRSVEAYVPVPRIPADVAIALELISAGAHDPREAASTRARQRTEHAVAALTLLATAVWSFDGALLFWT